MDLYELGRLVAKMRREKFLSQENVAHDLGISVTAYSKIENGKTNIGFERLQQIADYYNIPLSDFLSKAYQTKNVEKEMMEMQEKYNRVERKYEEMLENFALLQKVIVDKDKIIKLYERKSKGK